MLLRSQLVAVLGRMTLDQVIELWWEGQNELAGERETHQARLADPDDMYGKSREYVRNYYASEEELDADDPSERVHHVG